MTRSFVGGFTSSGQPITTADSSHDGRLEMIQSHDGKTVIVINVFTVNPARPQIAIESIARAQRGETSQRMKARATRAGAQYLDFPV